MATLDERQQMLLMAYADGELEGDADALREVEALLADDTAVNAEIAGLQTMRAALASAAMEPVALSRSAEDALSMVRGRVLTRLPHEARAAVVASAPAAEGWWARISWGRLAFGIGAVAAAVLLVLALRSPHQGEVGGVDGEVAEELHEAPAGEEPEVIIEEMEIDSGTIIVDPAEDADGPVIIWHLDSEVAEPVEEGAG